MLKVEKIAFLSEHNSSMPKWFNGSMPNIFPEYTCKSNITQVELTRFKNIHEYTCIYMYMYKSN